ncbi:MAG: polysaccharide biosynthesis C-terminal domain-containing protein, partial [Muribaculaceae bacterium]|nr:polysaccharide biosynthesis C-terminal domain-containing protein [Muribaculaceae bacterium]
LMRNAQIINILYTLAIIAVMGIIYLNLDRLGQPEELLPLIRPYYLLFMCGMLPMTVYNVWAQCSYGMKSTRMPMWIILGVNVLNVGGNYLLIYGHCGMPELGLFGAGLATLVARCASALIIVYIFMTGRRFAAVRTGYRASRRNANTVRLLFRT